MTRAEISGWKHRRGFLLPVLLAAVLLQACPAAGAQADDSIAGRTQPGAVFACGTIDSGRPVGRSVVFPSAQGTLYCYSDFVHVAAAEQITHRWFYRDREVAQFKLTIQPPRWSSYSSLKLPAGSAGPWRVDVTGPDGIHYGTARFSNVE